MSASDRTNAGAAGAVPFEAGGSRSLTEAPAETRDIGEVSRRGQ